MTDPHKLVERVRELTEHDEEHELRRRDRPPRSGAQRERVEGAGTEAAVREQPDPADDGAG